MTRRRGLGGIVVDVAPLRESRDFRLLFTSQLVSTLGSQLTAVAVPFQLYAETRSSLQVGAVSLVQLGPLVAGALVGGSVGDAVDRRKLLLVSSVLLGVTSGGLAVNSLASHPSVAAIYLISALAAALNGFTNTARNAVVPSLVRPALLLPAYSFLQVLFQLGTVVGPAVSGVLIGAIHLRWVYGVDAVTYCLCAAAVALMAPLPPVAGAARPGWSSVKEGIGYLRGRQALQGVYVIDINAMVFGMPRALFPAMADTVFHGGATTLGYLYAAVGAGGLVGGATTGWVERIRHQGWLIVGAVIVWGAAITAFGFSRVLALSLVLLAVGGWADVISAVVRNTVLQLSVPERLRSRISSIQMAVVSGGPRLGDLESGAVAAAAGTEFSIVSGGIACVAGALLLAALMPRFRRFTMSPAGLTPAAGAEVDGHAAAREALGAEPEGNRVEAPSPFTLGREPGDGGPLTNYEPADGDE